MTPVKLAITATQSDLHDVQQGCAIVADAVASVPEVAAKDATVSPAALASLKKLVAEILLSIDQKITSPLKAAISKAEIAQTAVATVQTSTATALATYEATVGKIVRERDAADDAAKAAIANASAEAKKAAAREADLAAKLTKEKQANEAFLERFLFGCGAFGIVVLGLGVYLIVKGNALDGAAFAGGGVIFSIVSFALYRLLDNPYFVWGVVILAVVAVGLLGYYVYVRYKSGMAAKADAATVAAVVPAIEAGLVKVGQQSYVTGAAAVATIKAELTKGAVDPVVAATVTAAGGNTDAVPPTPTTCVPPTVTPPGA
jgi:hypothetical protein